MTNNQIWGGLKNAAIYSVVFTFVSVLITILAAYHDLVDSIGKEQIKTVTELAYAEVISYNKKNLERELQNESRQHNRQQSRIKVTFHGVGKYN